MSDCVNGEAGPHIASTAIAIGAVIPKFIVAGESHVHYPLFALLGC